MACSFWRVIVRADMQLSAIAASLPTACIVTGSWPGWPGGGWLWVVIQNGFEPPIGPPREGQTCLAGNR